jgi:hypothetical protein
MKGPASSRWIFVDFFRFTAVLLMIQGHTFHAVLDPRYQQADWFVMHAFWHGFTAPMFFFASGLAFGIATFRKWDRHLTTGPVLNRRLRRYGLLLVLGYGLHLPFFSFQKFLETYQTSIVSFTKSDALHVIGLSLIIAQGLVLVLKKKHRLVLTLGAFAFLLVVIAPLMWPVEFKRYVPIGLAAYLNHQTGSVFSFLPWSSYLFAGLVTAYVLQPWKHERPPVLQLRTIAFCGLGLILAGYAFTLMPLSVYPTISWDANPAVFMLRLGTLMLYLVLLFQLERVLADLQIDRQSVSFKAIAVMAQETLSIYVLHLLILYGSVVNIGSVKIVGRSLSLFQAIVFFILLTVLMYLFSMAWHYLKTRQSRLLSMAQAGVMVLFMYFFFTNPF